MSYELTGRIIEIGDTQQISEEWRSIEGYEGKYEVSSYGHVRSLDRKVKSGIRMVFKKGTLLKPSLTTTGYHAVSMPHCKSVRIHRLVAQTFISPVEGKSYVNHKDGNRFNNRVENLEWCTQAENNRHSYSVLGNHNLKHKSGAENHVSKAIARLDEHGEVIEVYDTMKIASKKTNISLYIIRTCARGLRSSRPNKEQAVRFKYLQTA